MIVIDVETTGTDPKAHSLASIGALDFHQPENTFYIECRIWKGAEIASTALEINGFTENELTSVDKPTIEDAIHRFMNWFKTIEDRTIAGANPAFDRDFMRMSFLRASVAWPFSHRTVDLHSLIYADHLRRGKKPHLENSRTAMNLDYSLEYLGLPEEPRPHNALTGARMEAEAFSRIIYGKQLLSEFSRYPIPTFLTTDRVTR